jgi:hypothetical protein
MMFEIKKTNIKEWTIGYKLLEFWVPVNGPFPLSTAQQMCDNYNNIELDLRGEQPPKYSYHLWRNASDYVDPKAGWVIRDNAHSWWSVGYMGSNSDEGWIEISQHDRKSEAHAYCEYRNKLERIDEPVAALSWF